MSLRGRKGWSGWCAALLWFVSAAGAWAAGDAFFQGHVNGRVQGFAHTDLYDFRAEPGRERFYTELWFHEMQFAQEGLIVIVNVQMHNLGVSRGYCDDFRYEEFDPLPVPGAPIPCPGRTRVAAEHGSDRLTGSYRVQRIQERKEILSDYPTLFRQLARIITEETWSYRCWVEFDFDLHRDGKTRKIAGTGTANFIEPAPAGGGGNR